MVKIALIDSGIDVKQYRNSIVGGLSIEERGNSKNNISYNIKDNCGHGSQCASVILKECSNVKFYIIKIFGNELNTSYLSLRMGLEYLLKIDVDIINLSLSVNTSEERTGELLDIFRKLRNQGKRIFCATPNDTKSFNYIKDYSFWNIAVDDSVNDMYIDEEKHRIYVNSLPYLHYYMDGQHKLFGKSTSYATAKVSGKYALYMDKYDMDASIKFKEKYRKYEKYICLDKPIRKNLFQNKEFKKILDVTKRVLEVNDEELILNYSLFSSRIACHEDFCYLLVKSIEDELEIDLKPYDHFSQLDFITIYTLYERIMEIRKEKVKCENIINI